ncbi:dual specificity protein phosphatase PHS1 isoform X2 [Amborella trichopoda]|nr:dual specificity protein phosphatase PHS1 isoform X2 [Amborella trichopoda]|eukprot:XP_020521295.1 dual specificity protein phosphatase PHS1 isoform X2 [Amborella trichopoda]
MMTASQEREEPDEEEKEISLEEESPPSVSSCVMFLFGDSSAGPAYLFTKWLQSVRKQSGRYRSSGFPNRPSRLTSMPLLLPSDHARSREYDVDSVDSLPSEHAPEISLWERLGKAARLDIESSEFSWDLLASLHHTEHSSSTDQSEEEMMKPLEVTVNSGGVVFFALFNRPESDELIPNEAAAVIKFSSSRMATQSERLGYEFAKWLGIQTPQARVIHNSNPEWQRIKDAAGKAKEAAVAEGDEVGEMTCSELLEALELSRCLLLMNYVHGPPLLDSINAFNFQEVAEKTASALGRILLLDLVLRNEDRLPCRQLGWRGNPANLLFAEKLASPDMEAIQGDALVVPRRNRIIKSLQKERRFYSVDSRLSPGRHSLISQSSDASEFMASSPESTRTDSGISDFHDTQFGDFHIVAIDSGVPRRPPAGKRANDQVQYPKLVELLLNSSEFSANLLHELSAGKLGYHVPEECIGQVEPCSSDTAMIVHQFRGGFRAALRELQSFQIFLLTVYQKLDGLLRAFLLIINKSSTGDNEKEECGLSESLSQASGFSQNFPSSFNKERNVPENHAECSEPSFKSSSSSSKESPDSASPVSRENWHGRYSKGGGDPLRSLRLTTKLKDFNKYAKLDAELSKELEQWNEMLRIEAVKLCQDNNFHTGFFEGSDNNSVIDAYELKVRLDHLLERIALISDAANTERPSSITGNLFIGGALAARSAHTLQYLGITHILCLCSNETGQSESQYPELFEYKNFSICDTDDAKINNLFEDASDFIEHVESLGGKVLVHCFEGRSRSATVVLAYLILRKKFTLLDAWNVLKKVHRRAQPNDGFMRTLLELDKKAHGKASMEWQQRKPVMKVCPICRKNAGLSSSSLKLHLQKAHKRISLGSVDSAMIMEIEKALDTVRIS